MELIIPLSATQRTMPWIKTGAQLEQLGGVFFLVALAFGTATELLLGFNRLSHGNIIAIFEDGHGFG